MRVQNNTNHAIDVPDGPTLTPGESATVTKSDEITAHIEAGVLLDISHTRKTNKDGDK